ncbi:MAG: hypothetical protein PQJ60_00855 [Spirochaetales bacterium]|nr:hypothetical protein [Spirochaetales bacterium]
MFGFGFSEIITLVIVVIVLFNPKEMPRLLRKIGRIYSTIMKEVNGARKVLRQLDEGLQTISDKDIPIETGNKDNLQLTEGDKNDRNN